MTASSRTNSLYRNDSPFTRYTTINTISNGLYSCSHQHNLHAQEDYHNDESTSPSRQPSSPALDSIGMLPVREEISISISATSNGRPASYIQAANGEEEPGPCNCGRVVIERKRKKENVSKKENGMKLRRLILLIAVFILYVSLGAVIFNALEAGAELDRKDELDRVVEVFLKGNTCVNRSELYTLLRQAVVDSEIVLYVVENKTHLDRWDFSGAFGFVVSVVTTIGFGNLSPFTLPGKAVCVLYAIVGIPLTLLVLGGIGQKMATCVTKIRKCKNPMCHHTPKVNRFLNLFYIVSLGLVLIFIAPAAMFTYVEQWHFMESLYFCFTTLSTIGFGDYVIGIHETRLNNIYLHEFYVVFAYVWILLGLAYLSLVYRFITDTMVAKAQKMERSTIRRLGPEHGKDLPSTPRLSSSPCRSPVRESRPIQDSAHTADSRGENM